MPTDKSKSSKISISVPSDILAWLQRSAAKSRRSVSSLVTESLLAKYQRRNSK